jgi:DNA polymerase III subunit beta
MDLRLSRSEFLTELAPMQGIVERKTTVPVLSHLLLSTRDGKLHLAATDLDVSLTSWCNAEVVRDGAIAVQAKKFMEIIRALVGEEVHLVQEEPEWLEIRAGASRFKIHGMPADDFPQLPQVDENFEAQLPFADLRRMISKVLFAVSAEESRFQLNGALFKLRPDTLEMVATDGHRLALVESGLEGGPEYDSVLVARKALQELTKFEGDGTISYRRGEHHLSFRLGRRELICRILEGTFPDYDRVIARDNDRRPHFDRDALDDAISRVALLTGDRARTVKLDLEPGHLTISAANSDLGEAVEQVPCEYEGPNLVIGINPDYLRDFLRAVDTDRVRLELKDENTQCVCFPENGAGASAGAGDAEGDTPPQEASESGAGRYLCVIMPMRV